MKFHRKLLISLILKPQYNPIRLMHFSEEAHASKGENTGGFSIYMRSSVIRYTFIAVLKSSILFHFPPKTLS